MRPAAALHPPSLDVEAIRAEFPLLARSVGGRPIVYLDSAATTQKPRRVLEAVDGFYRLHNPNVHRGVHRLSHEATEAYEGAREKARRLLNAPETAESIFVRGVTEGINLVAQAWARPRLGPGDEILVTVLEHHSNIVPWQLVAGQTGAVVRAAPIDDRGALVLDELERLVSERTRIVAVAHASNALGTINPVKRIVEIAHAAGAIVLVDGAQAAAHLPIDVQDLGCDFYAISGHKMFGPTGIGVLWGKREHLESMPPWMGGGDMIARVTLEGSTWAELPAKFEAGTPNIAGAVGLGAAIDFLEETGLGRIAAHEHDLLEYGTDRLAGVEGIRLVGTAPEKSAVLSFVMDGVHPHDIGTILDHEGIAIRTGHHCAQPVMDRFGVPATARASLSVYNTREEIDRLFAGLEDVRRLFR